MRLTKKEEPLLILSQNLVKFLINQKNKYLLLGDLAELEMDLRDCYTYTVAQMQGRVSNQYIDTLSKIYDQY